MNSSNIVGSEPFYLAVLAIRKYDYETGRFNSIDPLFEKYYGWSPYQYSMNNPIWAKDWDGMKIIRHKTLDVETFDKKLNLINLTNIGNNIISTLEKTPIPVIFRDYPSESQPMVIPEFDKDNKLIKIEIEMDFKNMSSLFLSREMDKNNVDGKAAVLMEELKHAYDFIVSKNAYKLYQTWLEQMKKSKGNYNEIDLEKAADKAVEQMNKELKKIKSE